MTMTPINRIPAIDCDLRIALATELDNELLIQSLSRELLSALAHDSETDSLSCMMDWAMQIRSEFGMDWASCIRLASILYYG